MVRTRRRQSANVAPTFGGGLDTPSKDSTHASIDGSQPTQLSTMCYTRMRQSMMSEACKRKNRRHSAPGGLNCIQTSLEDILHGDLKKRQTKKQKKLEEETQFLQLKNDYFKMIDSVPLEVDEESKENIERSQTHRTIMRKNLKDPSLLQDYGVYKKVTENFVKPVGLNEFASSIRPTGRVELYDGLLDE